MSFSAQLPLGLQPNAVLIELPSKKSSYRTPVLAPSAHTGMAEGHAQPMQKALHSLLDYVIN